MENQNSVCYVAIINEIKQIPESDNIELAVVGGWNSIVKKGEYTVGDYVVVATTDAVIPQNISDAIGVTNYLRKGQRVRTVKLRGVYSECLIIPFDVLPPMKKQYASGIGYFWESGEDLMEILGIFKYEPPIKQIQLASGKKIRYRANSNFHVYYKFPNLKNVKGMFTEEDEVQITRKIHGTNARYGIVKKTKLSLFDKTRIWLQRNIPLLSFPEWKWLDYEYVYGSHNVEKGSDSQGFYSTDVWRTVAEQYDIKSKLWKMARKFGKDGIENGIVIYGEIYGAGIQKNYDYGLTEMKFALFDLTVDNEYQPTSITEWISGYILLPHVPILHTGLWSQEIQDKYTFKNFIEDTKVPHEGIVIKDLSGKRNKVAKVINPDYLIYGEKHDVGDSH
jgi:RNA ligase (TIGR02306 family)